MYGVCVCVYGWDTRAKIHTKIRNNENETKEQEEKLKYEKKKNASRIHILL